MIAPMSVPVVKQRRESSRRARVLLVNGLGLIIAPYSVLYIRWFSLFPANEPTTPGLLQLLLLAICGLFGCGTLLATALAASKYDIADISPRDAGQPPGLTIHIAQADKKSLSERNLTCSHRPCALLAAPVSGGLHLTSKHNLTMGAWGHGNIENDFAQDMLAEICDDYFRRIVDTLRSKHGHEYDEYEHDELFVLCEMLFALNERGMVNSSPEPDLLRPLFGPFVERWAAYHQRAGYEVPAERQKVMEDTFHKLTEIAEGASGGSFNHRIGLIRDKMSNPKSDET